MSSWNIWFDFHRHFRNTFTDIRPFQSIPWPGTIAWQEWAIGPSAALTSADHQWQVREQSLAIYWFKLMCKISVPHALWYIHTAVAADAVCIASSQPQLGWMHQSIVENITCINHRPPSGMINAFLYASPILGRKATLIHLLVSSPTVWKWLFVPKPWKHFNLHRNNQTFWIFAKSHTECKKKNLIFD